METPKGAGGVLRPISAVAVTLLMPMLSLSLSLSLSLALALALAPSAADAGVVGKVRTTLYSAYGTPPGESRGQKYPRDDVAESELLETGNDSGIRIKFLDATTLTLGANSRLVVDTFVFDPAGADQSALYTLALGTFRFVSGEMRQEGIILETPTAIIGIRGSEAVVFVAGDGSTLIDVISGIFTILSKLLNSTTEVAAGQQVSVSPAGVIGEIGAGNDGYTGQPFVDEADGGDGDPSNDGGGGGEG